MRGGKFVTSDWHEMPDHLMVSESIEIKSLSALESFGGFVVVWSLFGVWIQTDALLYKFCYTVLIFY